MIKKLLLTLLLVPTLLFAKGGGHRSYSSGHSHSSSHSYSHKSYTAHKATRAPKPAKISKATKAHNKNYCATCKRDKNGKIARSSKAKKQFEKQTGYPHGRKGYVVDHKVPLKKGGKDEPSNMQWQTVQDAKEKDKTE